MPKDYFFVLTQNKLKYDAVNLFKMITCFICFCSERFLLSVTLLSIQCTKETTQTIQSPRENRSETERRGWNHLTIFTRCKEDSRMMAFSPEGEFHGTKGRQKKNRAKSIRECKEESS